nr:hypothetical protein GCM10020093_038650 [Planobispora longispora]BFE81276.1 hypothetical protein GCM10020093_038770 [Planobispora longispora]
MPVDPSYPAERIGFIVEDAAPMLVVTVPELRERAPAGVPVVLLHEDGTVSSDADAASLPESGSELADAASVEAAVSLLDSGSHSGGAGAAGVITAWFGAWVRRAGELVGRAGEGCGRSIRRM